MCKIGVFPFIICPDILTSVYANLHLDFKHLSLARLKQIFQNCRNFTLQAEFPGRPWTLIFSYLQM